MTPEDDVPGAQFVRAVRYLLRHWYVVLAITAGGGGLGWVFARMQPVVFLGSQRLLVMQGGTSISCDATLKFESAMASDAVVEAALAALRSGGDTVPTLNELRPVLSGRLEFPPKTFVVAVRWQDALMASKLARAVAESALRTVREHHARQIEINQQLLGGQIDAAKQVLDQARAALARFRAENAAGLDREDEGDVGRIVKELRSLDVEIPAERARLNTMEGELAKLRAVGTESSLAPIRDGLAGRIVESRTRLAELQARKYAIVASARTAPLNRRQQELVADIERAEHALDLIQSTATTSAQSNLYLLNGIQMIDAPLVPGRPLTRRDAGIPRGSAAGLILPVFGVLCYRSIWASASST